MSELTLVSIVTENYLPRAVPFLSSLPKLVFAPYCVCLGFEPSRWLRDQFPYIRFYSMPMHWSADNGIFQHGRFLDALPDVSDDALYMLTDADILVQRDFTEAEIVRFSDYDKETFGVGWNACRGDDLAAEAERMGMRDDGAFGCQPGNNDVLLNMHPWECIPCYNTGVLCMRGHAWKRLRDLYESRVRGFWKLNPHRSRTQWLVNWCVHRLGLKADVLGGAIHSHGHHGIPQGVEIGADGIARYRGETVMFRHAF